MSPADHGVSLPPEIALDASALLLRRPAPEEVESILDALGACPCATKDRQRAIAGKLVIAIRDGRCPNNPAGWANVLDRGPRKLSPEEEIEVLALLGAARAGGEVARSPEETRAARAGGAALEQLRVAVTRGERGFGERPPAELREWVAVDVLEGVLGGAQFMAEARSLAAAAGIDLDEDQLALAAAGRANVDAERVRVHLRRAAELAESRGRRADVRAGELLEALEGFGESAA